MSWSAPNIEKAVELMGRPPVNPVGECFESAIRQALFPPDPPPGLRLCHGIGIANAPGQEGSTMGHAWVEWNAGLRRVALDTTWGVVQEASAYRANFQLSHVREYTRDQAGLLWRLHDMPGPWDLKIRTVTDGAARAKSNTNEGEGS
jgi:hypothetical protein